MNLTHGQNESKTPTLDKLQEAMGRALSVPEKHQLAIAYKTLNMPDAMVGVMGGMTKQQAKDTISKLTGKEYAERKTEGVDYYDLKPGKRVETSDGPGKITHVHTGGFSGAVEVELDNGKTITVQGRKLSHVNEGVTTIGGKKVEVKFIGYDAGRRPNYKVIVNGKFAAQVPAGDELKRVLKALSSKSVPPSLETEGADVSNAYQCCGQKTSETSPTERHCNKCGATWKKVDGGWSKVAKESVNEETHAEHAKKAKVATPCTSSSITFGGKCMNCGYDPNKKSVNEEHKTGDELDKIGIKSQYNGGDEIVTKDGRRWGFVGKNTWVSHDEKKTEGFTKDHGVPVKEQYKFNPEYAWLKKMALKNKYQVGPVTVLLAFDPRKKVMAINAMMIVNPSHKAEDAPRHIEAALDSITGQKDTIFSLDKIAPHKDKATNSSVQKLWLLPADKISTFGER